MMKVQAEHQRTRHTGAASVTATDPTCNAADLWTDGAVGIKDATDFSGLKRTTLYTLMDNGTLPYSKIGNRRLISKLALVRLLAAGAPAR